MRFFFYIFLIILPLTSFSKEEFSEQKKINNLLEVIRTSDVTFIRNGDEHSSQEAYRHLQRKLKAAQGSWFSPPKEEWTAILFIEKVASGSSLSGRPYLVRTNDGKTIEAKSWLEKKLDELENKKELSKDLE